MLAALPILATAALAGDLRAITFDEAIGLADKAPRVVASQRATDTKRDLDRRISRMTLNPILTVQPGFRVLPDTAREVELVAELAQSWNLAGHGLARRHTADLETQTLSAESRAVLLYRRLGAARSWMDLWAAQRVLEQTQNEEKIAAELVRLVERAASVSAATRADVADAKAYHAEARLMLLAAQGEVFERRVELAREAALPAGPQPTAAGDLPKPGLPSPSEWPALI
jgi:outer membrane protein, heavy metal efflux system